MDVIFNIVKRELPIPHPVLHVIGELVDNIYEHSEFNNAYVMIQKIDRTNQLELCFFDNGITIPTNFANYGITKSAADCIHDAINGVSTKKNEKGRGRGLNSSINICRGSI